MADDNEIYVAARFPPWIENSLEMLREAYGFDETRDGIWLRENDFYLFRCLEAVLTHFETAEKDLTFTELYSLMETAKNLFREAGKQLRKIPRNEQEANKEWIH